MTGLSDHDIVMTDNKILCTRQKPIKRTIYLWKNVDIVNMKIDTNTLSSNILKYKHDLQKNIEKAVFECIKEASIQFFGVI
jgi:hypothetical protein